MRWVSPGRRRRGRVFPGKFQGGEALVHKIEPQRPHGRIGKINHPFLVGEEVGGALTALVGTLGALIITSVGLVALSVGTVGWNPLRSLVHGMRAGGDAAGRTAKATAKALADKGKELAEARGQRAANGIVVIGDPEAEAVPGMQPEWAGVETGEREEEPGEERLDVGISG